MFTAKWCYDGTVKGTLKKFSATV